MNEVDDMLTPELMQTLAFLLDPAVRRCVGGIHCGLTLGPGRGWGAGVGGRQGVGARGRTHDGTLTLPFM